MFDVDGNIIMSNPNISPLVIIDNGLNEAYVMLNGSFVTKRDLLSMYIQIKNCEYGSFEEWLSYGLHMGYLREFREVDKV